MPIKVQRDLPAKAILEEENIFIMDEDRAMSPVSYTHLDVYKRQPSMWVWVHSALLRWRMFRTTICIPSFILWRSPRQRR